LVKKHRGLFEGPEWDQSRRNVEPDPKRFDDAFRWIADHIATEPRIWTTPFLSDNHRIMVCPISYTAELWIYFRIEPDDEDCTLLWIHTREHDIGLRAG
jgi:hypothetical protein